MYSDGVSRTFSVFLKYGTENKNLTLSYLNKLLVVKFNVNGVLNHVSNTSQSYNIEEYANGWYKASITDTVIGGAFLYTGIQTEDNQDGTSFFYIWGAQLEQNSYATSYIKTVGTTQTRVADTATGSGNSTVINSTEGVLYAEISALANDGTSREFSLSSGVYADTVRVIYSSTDNRINIIVRRSSATLISLNVDLTNVLNFSKIAFKYSSSGSVVYVDGILIVSSLVDVSFPINTLNTITFDRGDGIAGNFYGKTKSLQVYTTALSDAELISLTTI